jgi:hypothetical protein
MCALALAVAAACGSLAVAGCIGDAGDVASPYGWSYGGAGYAEDAMAPLDWQADSDASACSTFPPGQEAPCASEGSVCEYGSGVLVQCDVLATCTHAKWQITLPNPGALGCTAELSDACAPTLWTLPRGACAPLNLDCDYPEGRCECTQNLPRTPGQPAAWKCAIPSSSSSVVAPFNFCPAVRPRLGTACQPDDVRCNYGACELQGGSLEVCQKGVWVEEPVDCSCPAALPRAGSACSDDHLACEYGSSNLASCNTVASCVTGQWQVATPEAGAPCVPAPPGKCPASRQALQGAPCTELGLDCDYGDVRCECNNGPTPQSDTTWRCDDPALAGPGCGPRPRIGSPCAVIGLQCTYGGCDIRGGSEEVCGDVWFASNSNCTQTQPLPFPGDTTCPTSPPPGGMLCFTGDLVCEYGSSHVAACNVTANCNGFGPATSWLIVTPDAGDPSCTAAPPAQCPTSFTAVPRGTDCSGSPSACDYPEGRCRCAPAPAAPTSSRPVWSCQDPPAGCPEPRPNLGTACVQEGLVCPYEGCSPDGGLAEMCLMGVWKTLAINCLADAGLGGPPASGAADSSPD